MLRNWNMLKLASALAVTLAAPPASFAGEDVKRIQEDVKKILERMDKDLPEAIEKQIGKKLEGMLIENFKKLQAKVEKDLEEIRTFVYTKDVEFEKLQKQVNKLAKDIEAIKRRVPAEGNIALYPPDKTLEEIRARLEQIERALKNGTTRVALSPPSTSRMLLINLYPEELLFVVNGQSHRVPPNTTKPIDNLLAGPVTYEVISARWGLRQRNTVTLRPNEIFTLTATLP